MFDFAWSEIALIGIVALVAIGPKDLPVAIKAVTQMIKKARRMAGEFQTHVDEMMREADLGDVKESFNQLRRMDIKGQILRAVDDDGTLRSSLKPPSMDFSPKPPPIPVHDAAPATDALPATDAATGTDGAPEPIDVHAAIPGFEPVAEPIAAVPPRPVAAAPAFVPPKYAPAQPAHAPAPPAFVPPSVAAAHAAYS